LFLAALETRFSGALKNKKTAFCKAQAAGKDTEKEKSFCVSLSNIGSGGA